MKILFKHSFKFKFSVLFFLAAQFAQKCATKPTNSKLVKSGSDYQDQGEEISYPFQQYIQVRKEYTVEHLPVHEGYEQDAKPNSNNLETSASSPVNQNSEDSDSDGHDHSQDQEDDDIESTSHYVKPRLREEITDYKKQEVYEEKGHSDGAYDHKAYRSKAQHRDDDNFNDYNYEHEPSDSNHHHRRLHRNHGRNKNKNKSDRRSKNYDSRRSKNTYENPETSSTNVNHNYRRNNLYHRLHTPDGRSSKVLEYAASNLYDRDAHNKGIYAARDSIYCPEVIDFDLSSKKMAMGQGGNNPRGAKPRLGGLGDKITCLKNKYFGREPLSKAIFLYPSESRHSVIEIPSFDQFYKDVRGQVDSMSSFQRY